jgi:hypothetical protein
LTVFRHCESGVLPLEAISANHEIASLEKHSLAMTG